MRFLESFWPINPKYSHVLVLSPQVEVSPLFFHCKAFRSMSAFLATDSPFQTSSMLHYTTYTHGLRLFSNGTTGFLVLVLIFRPHY